MIIEFGSARIKHRIQFPIRNMTARFSNLLSTVTGQIRTGIVNIQVSYREWKFILVVLEKIESEKIEAKHIK
jgi:hypothetical protein